MDRPRAPPVLEQVEPGVAVALLRPAALPRLLATEEVDGRHSAPEGVLQEVEAKQVEGGVGGVLRVVSLLEDVKRIAETEAVVEGDALSAHRPRCAVPRRGRGRAGLRR